MTVDALEAEIAGIDEELKTSDAELEELLKSLQSQYEAGLHLSTLHFLLLLLLVSSSSSLPAPPPTPIHPTPSSSYPSDALTPPRRQLCCDPFLLSQLTPRNALTQGVSAARPWLKAGKTKKEDTIAAMSPKLTLLRSVMVW